MGDFLLRSLKNGKMILCVNDNGSAVNFTIKRNDKGQFIFAKQSFANAEALIDTLRVSPPKNSKGAKLWLQDAAPFVQDTKGGVSRDRDDSVKHYGFDQLDTGNSI